MSFSRFIFASMAFPRFFRTGWLSGGILIAYFLIPVVGMAQTDLTPVIQVSANVYIYRLDSEKQLGLFYQYNRKTGSVQSSDVFLHGTENITDTPIRALDISGSFSKFSYGSIDYNLKTAIEEGRATLITHQRGMTKDGGDFSFHVGEQTPLTVIEVKGTQTTLKTEDRSTGIQLSVKPRIFRGSNVLMDLEIESSEITRIDTFDRGDEQRYELPVITTRKIMTVVIVPSDQPVFIGGLYTDNSGEITRKIPIVGDLPVIGFFTRGFNKKKRQTETIFKITPTIKMPGEGLDMGSSVFEELLQPDSAASNNQDVDALGSGAQIVSPSDVVSPTAALMVPSPLIPSATAPLIPSATASLIPSATTEPQMKPVAPPEISKEAESNTKRSNKPASSKPWMRKE